MTTATIGRTARSRLHTSARLLAAVGLMLGTAASIPGEPATDQSVIVVRGGAIYDGSARVPVIGDVVVKGDTIVDIGPSAGARYRDARIIDARGMIVAPGFIDPHTHADALIWSESPRDRLVVPWITQGVTTVFTGSDGQVNAKASPVEVLDRTERLGMGPNIIAYVGFGTVRRAVLGENARAPDAGELARMKTIVAEGMCAGAFGLSTGLFYAPQSFAATDEVIAVAREAAKRGGVYDTHQRDEASYSVGLTNSMREAIRIGETAGMPVHFAHLKALGTSVHGKAPEMVALVEQARLRGTRVTADQYPYAASSTGLAASLVPRWALDGGAPAMIRRLADPADHARIAAEMRGNLTRRGGAAAIMLNDRKGERDDLNGRYLDKVAADWGIDPVAAAIRILVESKGEMSIISFNMDQRDIALIMQQPWTVTGSDGSEGHPRMYGSFPEKYAEYVVNRKVISIAEFINSSSGRTADIFGIARRGHLRTGYYADIVVFDPSSYRPRATYLRPRDITMGVRTVLVNGQLAIDDGRVTGVVGGRPIRHVPPAQTCP